MKAIANIILALLLAACESESPPPSELVPDTASAKPAIRASNNPRDLKNGQFHERGREQHDRSPNAAQ